MPTINLSWTPAGGAATGQKIYRSNDTGVNYTLLATVSSTTNSYSDTTAAAGDVYFYKVATVCASGDEETLPVDICADGSITTPIALQGINYIDPPGTPFGFAQHFSHFTFSIGELTTPGQHYQVSKIPSTETDNNTQFVGGPGSSSSPYNYCDGGWCTGNANADNLSASFGVTSMYGAYDGQTWYTKVDIYFDGVLLQSLRGDVAADGVNLGRTYNSSNPTGFGTQFLKLDPKGGSGFYLVVSLVPAAGE